MQQVFLGKVQSLETFRSGFEFQKCHLVVYEMWVILLNFVDYNDYIRKYI